MRDPTKYFVLFALLFFFLSHWTYPQFNVLDEIKFKHITKDDGLPSGVIWCITQDSKGFLWFGTYDGLVRYDGLKCKVFKYSPEDNKSIGGNNIKSIYVDKSGTLWAGTSGGGLNKYNPIEENFTKYVHNPEDSTSISSNHIMSILEDKEGTLWLGLWDGVLNKFDREKEKFVRYKNILGDPNSVSGNPIISMLEDSEGNFWILAGGLTKFDQQNQKFTNYFIHPYIPTSLSNYAIIGIYEDTFSNLWIATNSAGLIKFTDNGSEQSPVFKHYKIDPNNPGSFSHHKIHTIYVDQKNEMWIGMWGGGLSKTNLSIEDNSALSFVSFKHDPHNPFSLSDNFITCIYPDNSGLLLFGAYSGGGVNIYDTKQKQFVHYKHEPNNPLSLSASGIFSIYEDRTGILWIGTSDGRLNKIDRKTNKFTNYRYITNNPGTMVLEIFEDRSGILWLGTGGDGLIKFDRESEKFYQYKNNPLNPKSISDNNILSIYEDHSGGIWIGTYYGGLNKFDREKEQFIRYENNPEDPGSISGTPVTAIEEDSNGVLWIGTFFGLDALDIQKGVFTHYINDSAKLTSLSNNKIITMYRDKSNTFWIGTHEGGLNKFNIEIGQFKCYKMKDGLPNDHISGILEDNQGNLWISTLNGLSKFNPLTESFRNYDAEDGLQNNEFEVRVSCKSKTGELIFGGINGFNIFYPDSIKDNTHIPPVFITDLYLFNKPVPVGYDSTTKRTILKCSLIESEEIELNFDDKVFSFEFAALDYHSPQKNKYAYLMEGFDKGWNYTDASRNVATYTNLDPGEYTFRVKGSNNDGYWNEEGASIKIIILPPWWRTNIVYLFYILFITGAIYFTWKLQLKRIKNKHAYEMSKFEAAKLHEVDELKSRFFANISHEFRTPLTLILGPAKDVIEKTKEKETKQNVGLIKRNASRLLGLVNQLLDLSKLEAGKMKLEAKEENIIPLLKGLVLSFSSLADLKKINLNFKSDKEEIRVYLDNDKIEKIVNNLLSNAFKFTPEGGKIDVTVEKAGKEVAIKIADSGVGIPREKLEKIFDRFYQVDGSQTREQEGTGIGLALTKELVELLRGKIEVESEVGKGTSFIVNLPLGKDHLKPEEIVEEKTEAEVQTTKEDFELILETTNRKEKTDIDVLLDTEKPLLLVVEDNSDVRKYIISHLEANYRIQEAVDGEDGLKEALNHIPDLIISDVMMPKLDGFQLCNKLKTDERTSHIPIIMLTAKATSQDKISGYETGADDYIMKPFDAAELKARIKNLIDIRRRLQEKFRSADFAIPPELSSIDELFMKRVMKVINEHISEEKFSIDELGKEVGMSREHIYRKLKAISGHSTSLFIRSVRLAKAKKLIKERKGTISEISFLVGFSSPAYFGKCFKEEFGYSPGEI